MWCARNGVELKNGRRYDLCVVHAQGMIHIRLDDVLVEHVDQRCLPGLVTAVQAGGQVARFSAYAVAWARERQREDDDEGLLGVRVRGVRGPGGGRLPSQRVDPGAGGRPGVGPDVRAGGD